MEIIVINRNCQILALLLAECLKHRECDGGNTLWDGEQLACKGGEATTAPFPLIGLLTHISGIPLR